MGFRSYRSYAEFEREEIRPGFKIGFSIDDLEEAVFDPANQEEGDDFSDDYEGDDY